MFDINIDLEKELDKIKKYSQDIDFKISYYGNYKKSENDDNLEQEKQKCKKMLSDFQVILETKNMD